MRTGDTPQSERARLRKSPPHILVTTPESLYVLLGSESGRAMLAPTRTVIVDEIHAMVPSKRGSHLALSLERLEALCGRRLTRIGLSATQKPIDEVARFLVGTRRGRRRRRRRTAPSSTSATTAARPRARTAAGAAGAGDVERAVGAGLRAHRRTGRKRIARRWSSSTRGAWPSALRATWPSGSARTRVAAHHGSLAQGTRLDAEQRLKRGELKVLVATASLELGIDIGDVDLVCQLGSPRSIAALPAARRPLRPPRRRRAEGAAVPAVARRPGRMRGAARLRAPRRARCADHAGGAARRAGAADRRRSRARANGTRTRCSTGCAARGRTRDCARKDFDAVVRMLAEGFSTRRGTRAGYLHRDAVHKRLRGRKGGRLTAVTSGGTIPDTGDYDVVLEPQATTIGTVNEDFAIESMAGDIFQLGNASYRDPARRARARARRGCAGRAAEHSVLARRSARAQRRAVARRVAAARRDRRAACRRATTARSRGWSTTSAWSREAARQLVDYFARQHAALGADADAARRW